MNFLKYFLLATLLHGYPSCSMGQTVDKTIEANYALGLKAETNLIKNPSAGKNRRYVTAVGLTPTRDTSAGNKIDNKASWSIDATAINNYQEFELIPTPDDLTSGNCGFSGIFKGDATLYRAQILDGSSNVLAQTVPLTNETGWREFKVWYPCGASGARKVRITQTEAGTAPAINVGKFYYGRMEPGAGTSPNTFSAKVSATGIVSNVTPPGWLTNFSVSGIEFTGTTFKSGLFTQTPNCIAVVDTSSGANFTYSIRTYNTTTSTIGVSSNSANATTAAPFTITCTKTGSDYVQPAITPDQTAQMWSGYLTASSGWTNATAAYADLSAGTGVSLTTLNSSNVSVSAASGSLPGINFVPNATGLYHVCVNSNMRSSGALGTSMYIRLMNGSSVISSGIRADSPGVSYDVPASLCGLASLQSGVSATFKIQAYSVSGTLTLSNYSSANPLSFTIVQLSQNFPTPLLLNTVYSKYNGTVRKVSGIFAGSTNAATNCTTSPCTVHRDYGGISSVTRSAAGSYSLTFSEAFPLGKEPVCTCSCLENLVAYRQCSSSVSNQTQVHMFCTTGESVPVGKDAIVQFMCEGGGN